jgi:hypothetical protein
MAHIENKTGNYIRLRAKQVRFVIPDDQIKTVLWSLHGGSDGMAHKSAIKWPYCKLDISKCGSGVTGPEVPTLSVV